MMAPLIDNNVFIGFLLTQEFIMTIHDTTTVPPEHSITPLDAFFLQLDSLGGFFDVSLLANKLNVSEKSIKEDIATGKLLSVDRDGVELIPAFQFSAFKKLPGLEDVLLQMPEISSLEKAAFLISEIDILRDTPAHALKKNPSEDTLNIILKSAAKLK